MTSVTCGLVSDTIPEPPIYSKALSLSWKRFTGAFRRQSHSFDRFQVCVSLRDLRMGGPSGVGPYTSRAIASIAFQQPEAVVDGNVIRVLSRLFAVSGDPKKQQRHFQALADALLDRQHPGDFNQAVMELGAIVCRPSNPQCQECPIQLHCMAYQTTLRVVKKEDGASMAVPQVAPLSIGCDVITRKGTV